jgi:[amino group carrier protein]-lysine/ornithine hydrolase
MKGKSRFVYKAGIADLNIAAPVWKCFAVVYGPGDSSLDHTRSEHIDFNDYQSAINGLANVLLVLLA